jgi:hypothetical protein
LLAERLNFSTFFCEILIKSEISWVFVFMVGLYLHGGMGKISNSKSLDKSVSSPSQQSPHERWPCGKANAVFTIPINWQDIDGK